MDSLDSKYLAQLFVVSLTVKTSLSLVCVGVGGRGGSGTTWNCSITLIAVQLRYYTWAPAEIFEREQVQKGPPVEKSLPHREKGSPKEKKASYMVN